TPSQTIRLPRRRVSPLAVARQMPRGSLPLWVDSGGTNYDIVVERLQFERHIAATLDYDSRGVPSGHRRVKPYGEFPRRQRELNLAANWLACGWISYLARVGQIGYELAISSR